jgi:hypothetical protein
MRRLIAFAMLSSVAACAPRPQAVSTAPTPPTQVQAPDPGNPLTGLTAQELVGRFGTPALQIREGSSVKLQFRGRRCVMDAYLYPSGGPANLKVTHVDTRNLTGGDMDQAACIFSLRNAAI